jgi:hypothetical protein
VRIDIDPSVSEVLSGRGRLEFIHLDQWVFDDFRFLFVDFRQRGGGGVVGELVGELFRGVYGRWVVVIDDSVCVVVKDGWDVREIRRQSVWDVDIGIDGLIMSDEGFVVIVFI